MKPRDLADRLKERSGLQRPSDGFVREKFLLPIEVARAKAREVLDRYPAAAYMTEVESWRELPNGRIEFTMRRLPTAD